MKERVIILQGVSGSGKSTWARAQPNAAVVSADALFYGPDGVYRWDEARLSEAHNQCLKRFAQYLAHPTFKPVEDPEFIDTIIVDNTNTRVFFMAPYVALARAFDSPVEVHSFRVPPEVAAARNSGRAPASVVAEMAASILDFQMPAIWVRDGVQLVIHDDKGQRVVPPEELLTKPEEAPR